LTGAVRPLRTGPSVNRSKGDDETGRNHDTSASIVSGSLTDLFFEVPSILASRFLGMRADDDYDEDDEREC
jgi:hypothetical protein